MSCIVLDVEHADKNAIEEFGVFNGGNVQEYSFSPPRNYKATKEAFWCTGNLHGIVQKRGCLDYSELANILPRGSKDIYVEKRTETCKNLGSVMDKGLDFLEDHGSPNVQDFSETDEERWICSKYSFRHKTTLQCSDCNAKLFVNWTWHHLKM